MTSSAPQSRKTSRLATAADIPELVDLGELIFKSSPWSKKHQIDRVSYRRLCVQIVKEQTEGGATSAIFVNEHDHKIDALLVGFVRPMYECLSLKYASNLIWYAKPNASPRGGVNVMKAFNEWVDAHHKPVLHRYCITSTMVNHKLVGAYLTRICGFEEAGGIYQKGPVE